MCEMSLNWKLHWSKKDLIKLVNVAKGESEYKPFNNHLTVMRPVSFGKNAEDIL